MLKYGKLVFSVLVPIETEIERPLGQQSVRECVNMVSCRWKIL